MKIDDKVVCTKKLHGAFSKGYIGTITNIDDDVILVGDTPVEAMRFKNHFRVVKYFQTLKIDGKKRHLHQGRNVSVCGKRVMTTMSEPVDDETVLGDDVCKACYNVWLKENS